MRHGLARDALRRLAGYNVLTPEEVDALLDRLPPEQLPWLDQVLRRTNEELLWITPRMLSFHRSGYEREAAVQRLAQCTTGAELPYLLLRLKDWVPQVRDAAERAVAERIRPEYLPHFARNFILVREPLLHRLRTLLDDPILPQLLPTAPRSLIRFLLEHSANVAPVVRSALTHADDLVRTWAVRHVSRVLPPEEALATLARLASDRAPAVRREALSRLPADARPFFERALFDCSAAVRQVARSALHDVDVAARYRDALTTAHPVALTALSEVGSAADAALIVPFLSHERAAVRRAAVRSASRLAGEAYAQRLADMLLDPSRAVSAAARIALRRHVPILGQTRLEQLLTAATSPHARENIVALMSGLPKWQSITSLLRAAAVPGAISSIAQWNARYNRTQTAPSRSEIEALAAALAQAAASLDERLARELQFTLRSVTQP
jgi:hypothetical protein